jgi:ferredoxin
MKAKVDKETCLGCGLCVSLYPELFEMGKDGHSHVKEGVKIDEKKLEEVMRSCPTGAIEIIKDKKK